MQGTIIAHSVQSLGDREKSAATQGFFHSWRTPPVNLVLESDEVHLWRAALNLTTSRRSDMEQILSADEHARANRFRFLKDRKRFIAARGLLRTILECYVRVDADRLRLSYNEYGKPFLVGASCGGALRFNLSHSDEVVLYAFTRGREIGIDVERVRPSFADEEIAERFFSGGEVSALRELPANKQQEAFFNCWTRKEAYIKARGLGMTLGLDQFEVSLEPGEPAELLHVKSDSLEASRWCMRHLAPAPGYVAAVVVEGADLLRFKCYEWR